MSSDNSAAQYSEVGILSSAATAAHSSLGYEHGREKAEMRTYYRGPDAVVTADRFIWRSDTPRIFPLRELRDIRRVEHVPQGRPADVVMVAAAGAVAFAAASWVVLGPVIGAAAVVVTVTAAIAAVSTRRFRDTRSYRVIATVRGARTVIYEAREPRVFNQVTRALNRAVEDDHRARADYRLAAA